MSSKHEKRAHEQLRKIVAHSGGVIFKNYTTPLRSTPDVVKIWDGYAMHGPTIAELAKGAK